MTNLADNLVRTAQKLPDGAAIKLDDFTLTWQQFDDATQRVVTFLRDHGIEPGDRVALSLANVPAFPVVFYGILLAGGGSLLHAFAERVQAETGMPAYLAESPLTCVAVGAGQALDQLDTLGRSARRRRSRPGDHAGR